MILQFAIHIITTLIILSRIHPLASAQYSIDEGVIAQYGCNSTCGDVEIPFPFGMKYPKCYANSSWFEIECRNTSLGHTPYLKSLNLEVTYINPSESTIRIMNPVYYWNCHGKNTNKSGINLRGSPFVYSQDANTFVAVGCNNIALLRSNGSAVGGCVSICDSNEQVNDQNSYLGDLGNTGCHGKYCCETSLPMNLSEYNVTLQNMRNDSSESDQCSYAAILSYYRSYYYSYYGSGYDEVPRFIGNLKNVDHVEAVLEWVILNEMLTNSTFKVPSNVNCYGSNVTSSRNGISGRRCECFQDFHGNPYIAGGCIGNMISSLILDVCLD